MRRCLLTCLFTVLLGSVCAVQAMAAGTLTVSSVSGTGGELVDVTVSLTSDDVCAGSFEVCYDSAVLELTDSGTDAEFQCIVNPTQAGTVKVSFVRMTPIEEALLCTLTFRIAEDTDAQSSAVALQNVRLKDGNTYPVEAEVIQGAVERRTVRLSIVKAETAGYQAVQAVVKLGGTLEPAGGNFSVSYDPQCFEVKSVSPLEALEGVFWDFNVVEPGLVRVTFAGDAPLAAGELCAVVLQVLGEGGTTSRLTLSDVQMYGTEGPLDVTLTDGTVSVLSPSGLDPELWVTGGAIRDSGSAEAAVVLQGRGYVCGGSLTLRWEPGMKVTAASDICQFSCDPESGTAQISWASAVSYTGETELLTVTFTGAVESDVTLEQVILYGAEEDGDGKPLTIEEKVLHHGRLTAAQGAAAVKREATLASGTCSVTLDISDRLYGGDSQRQSLLVVMAVYESGRMVSLTPHRVIFSTGIATVTCTGEWGEDATEVRLFITGGFADMTPLTQAVKLSAAEMTERV